MPATLTSITHEALELPPRKRAKLAHTLILSIDPSADQDVASAWDVEIQRRVDDIRSGKVKGIPAREVFARLKSKYH